MENGRLKLAATKKIIGFLLSGQYHAGQRLPAERTLCQNLGISRGTLRDALADLEKMGVVERYVGRGTFIRELSQAKIPDFVIPLDIENITLEDIHFARHSIEISALDYCQGRISKPALSKMEKLVGQMSDALDRSLPEFIKHDSDFHKVMIKGCGNPAIYAAYRAIDEYRQFLQVYTTAQNTNEADSLRYHQKILAALKAGNKALAKRHLSAHLNDVIQSAGKQKTLKIKIRERVNDGQVYF